MSTTSITIKVTNGPSITVPWTQGVNTQQAMESAFNAQTPPHEFTYSLQYFGTLGYLVIMINETYESFMSSESPFYYWEFLVNGVPSQKGIDNTILNAGDTVTFELQSYNEVAHASSTVSAKHKLRLRAQK